MFIEGQPDRQRQQPSSRDPESNSLAMTVTLHNKLLENRDRRRYSPFILDEGATSR
jgi:hypothetical protein